MKASDTSPIKKASLYAIIINALQILGAAAVALYLLLSRSSREAAPGVLAGILALLLIVTVGAVLDIIEAARSLRMKNKVQGLTQAVQYVEELNKALRAQRHDFRNHLQVISGLVELEEYEDALKYIRDVNGDIRTMGQSLKTSSPAVNALLMVKTNEARQKGIVLKADVIGLTGLLPLPEWEMCRVLSNLIDNAMDALGHTRHGMIQVTLEEKEKKLRIAVGNNGPRIPQSMLNAIFEAGFSRKGEGRGMGLYIVRQIFTDRGGSLLVSSDDRWTVFHGEIPMDAPAAEDHAQ